MSLSNSCERLSKLLASLSDEQREAVTPRAGVILVDAGAGAGKTRTLASRAASLLLGGAKSRNVVAATFTRAAALTLQNRVRQLTGADIRVCTLHSWAKQILESSGVSVKIADEAARDLLVRETVPRETEPEIIKAIGRLISRAKNQGQTPETFVPAANTNLDLIAATVHSWPDYERAKATAGLLDFDDLISECLRLLFDDPRALARSHRTWRHILVDEFQDVNVGQYSLLRTVFEGRPINGQGDPTPASAFFDRSLAIVGDPDQAIYGFRGGQLGLMLGFAADYPGCKVVHLGTNYRSQASVVEVASAVINRNTARLPKQISASRAAAKLPRLVEVASRREAHHAVAAIAGNLMKAEPNAEVAVLFRRNRHLREFSQALTDLGVRVRSSEGTRFEELPEVHGAIRLVEAARHPRNDFLLMAALKALFPNGRLPFEFVKALRGNRSLWDVAAHSASPEAVAVRSSILAVRESGTDLGQVLTALMQTHWMPSLRENAYSSRRSRETLYELQRRLLGESRYDDPLNALSEKTRGVLEALTVHKSKGLERDYCFLLDLQGDVFPDPEGDLEEERRLFYVALTRAREGVFLVYEKDNPSRFVSELPRDQIARFDWHS